MRPRALVALAAVLSLLAFAISACGAGGGATGPASAGAAEPAAPYAGPSNRRDLVSGWGYRPDPHDLGAGRHWERRASARHYRSVRLPFSPNALPITGARGERSYGGSVGWFRRELRVSRTGRYRIQVESAHHDATLWIDGRRLGRHIGAYDPFSFETTLAQGRTHVLIVRLDWRSPRHQERQGWHRGWFNFGSLRGVSLRSVLPIELSSPTIRTVLGHDSDGVRTATVDVGVVVANHGAAPAVVQPQAGLRRGAREIPIALPAVTVAAGRRRHALGRVVIRDPALWSPDAPNLYDLRFAVPGVGSYRLRVGLREISRRGSRLYLNGHRLVLHGASLQEDAYGHGDALRPVDQDRLVAELRQIGANATRVQHPLDQGLLERLDAAGIFVWQQIGPWDSPGNWTSQSAHLQRQARARVRRTVEQDQAHPSILAWVLGNELAGDDGHPGGQEAYVVDMADRLHAVDPGRLVAVDLWGKHIPRHPGALYDAVDAIGVTSYLGWYEHTYASRSRVRKMIHGRLGRVARLFPTKVLVVSEFGAEANGRNRTHGHGGYAYQAGLLANHVRTYADVPGLSGMLIWTLRDFALSPGFAGGSISGLVHGIRLVRGINQKGLFDIHGRPKPSVAVVRRAFAAAG